MLALRHLSAKTKACVAPLIDVASPSRSSDKAEAEAYVARNIANAAKVVSGFPVVLIDSSELDPDFCLAGDAHPLVFAAQSVIDAGVRVIPVTGLHRDKVHLSHASNLQKQVETLGVCIRLDETDVSTTALTNKRISDLISAEAYSPERVYLLFDLQCLWGRHSEAISKQVLRLLRMLSETRWAGIIVGGYGFPDQLSDACSTNESTYIPRVEQDVFSSAAKLALETPIWFSDYSVLSPSSVELDPRLIRRVMTPKAIYTLDDTWFVVRGGAFSRHPDGYGQYFSIADEIIALAEFSGADFSYGDRYIYERYLRNTTPGNPASWITACVNRHITCTAFAHWDEKEG